MSVLFLFLDIVVAYFAISLILETSGLTGISLNGGLIILIILPFVFSYYLMRHISAIFHFRKVSSIRNINFVMIIFHIIIFTLNFASFNPNYSILIILLILASFTALQVNIYLKLKYNKRFQ